MHRVVAIGWVTGLLLFALSCANNEAGQTPNRSANNREPHTGIADTALWKSLEAFAQEGCVFNETPIKGSTNQGGYAFEYESRSGTGPTGACRWYRLRNTPGKLYTPVRWKDLTEIWFDTALARCDAGSTCPWIDVVKHSLRAVDGRSALSYGVNKDEFSDDPSAFKRHGDEKSFVQGRGFPPLVTTVSGVIADVEQRPIPISIRVVSFVSPSAPPYEFAYEISTGPTSDLSVALNGKPGRGSFQVIWGATSSKAFRKAAADKGLESVAGSEQQANVKFEERSLTVNLEELLVITQGGQPIFVTTAAAYRPGEER